MRPAKARAPVSVLSGFLGSGKTTLLRELLARGPGAARIAVLVNELSGMRFDHLLVQQAAGQGIASTSGCLCCAAPAESARAIAGLIERADAGEIPRFERIVVETSGLADPAAVLADLLSSPWSAARLRIDGLIVAADACHIGRQLDTMVEAVAQIAVADRIVLTKTDLCPPGTAEQALAAIARHNATAPLRTAIQGRLEDDAWLFDAGLYDARQHRYDPARWLRPGRFAREPLHAHAHTPDVATLFVPGADGVPWLALNRALQQLLAFAGDALLRLKGVVRIAESADPVALHAVHRLMHPPAPLPLASMSGAPVRYGLVLITQGLPAASLRTMFAPLA